MSCVPQYLDHACIIDLDYGHDASDQIDVEGSGQIQRPSGPFSVAHTISPAEPVPHHSPDQFADRRKQRLRKPATRVLGQASRPQSRPPFAAGLPLSLPLATNLRCFRLLVSEEHRLAHTPSWDLPIALPKESGGTWDRTSQDTPDPTVFTVISLQLQLFQRCTSAADFILSMLTSILTS